MAKIIENFAKPVGPNNRANIINIVADNTRDNILPNETTEKSFKNTFLLLISK